jgi:hypothetical protein
LILAFLRCAIAAGIGDTTGEIDDYITDVLDPRSVDLFMSGRLTVRHHQAGPAPWEATYTVAGPAGEEYELALGFLSSDVLARAGETSRFHNVSGGPNLAVRLGIPVKPGPGGAQWPRTLDFTSALPEPGQSFRLVAQVQANSAVRSVRTLAEAGALGRLAFREHEVGLVSVLRVILNSSLLLAGPRSEWKHSLTPAELHSPPDFSVSSDVPATLFTLRNSGTPTDRSRWKRVTEIFQDLTGMRLDVNTVPDPVDLARLLIRPILVRDGAPNLPVELAGAGTEESLFLALTLSAPPGSVLVLDEPGTSLSAARLRRLLAVLRQGGRQTVVITHNPNLVPVSDDAAEEVIRLDNLRGDGTVIRGRLGLSSSPTTSQHLADTDVRDLLFARGVVLCEGETEVEVLRRWWGKRPIEDEVSIVSVGSDTGFAAYAALADSMGLPWAVIADGPALRPVTGRVAKMVGLPATTDFMVTRDTAEKKGIFTFADRFGDDGTKGGEIEAFLRRTDAEAYERVLAEHRKSKIRAGRAFAESVGCPPEVQATYDRIRWQLLGGVRSG